MSRYQKLQTSETASDDSHIEQSSTNLCACAARRRNIIPWMWCGLCTLVTVVAVITSCVIVRKHTTISTMAPTLVIECNPDDVAAAIAKQPTPHTTKYPTDFVSAPEIPLVEKYYYNYYDFNPSTKYLEYNMTNIDDGILYSGYPTKAIDQAWADLLEGSYMAATDEEIESVRKVAPWDLERMDDGQIYMEVGVFHNLHCVDLIRRALEPQYYNIHSDFTWQLRETDQRVHVYHCIDQLRQAVQCHGDLTPVPMFSVNGPQKKFFATHSVNHTCRDWSAVKEWRAERNKLRAPFDWSAWE